MLAPACSTAPQAAPVDTATFIAKVDSATAGMTSWHWKWTRVCSRQDPKLCQDQVAEAWIDGDKSRGILTTAGKTTETIDTYAEYWERPEGGTWTKADFKPGFVRPKGSNQGLGQGWVASMKQATPVGPLSIELIGGKQTYLQRFHQESGATKWDYSMYVDPASFLPVRWIDSSVNGGDLPNVTLTVDLDAIGQPVEIEPPR